MTDDGRIAAIPPPGGPPHALQRSHTTAVTQGPVYFNVIRPFHHLIVGGMAGAGAKLPR